MENFPSESQHCNLFNETDLCDIVENQFRNVNTRHFCRLLFSPRWAWMLRTPCRIMCQLDPEGGVQRAGDRARYATDLFLEMEGHVPRL